MAKKKNGVLKLAVGIGAAAVAGKVAYDKVKAAKSKLTKEENDSAELEVRKYNAVCENRDRKSTRLNSSHKHRSRMPSSA